MSSLNHIVPLERLRAVPRRTTFILFALLFTLLVIHAATSGSGSSSYRYSKDALRRESWRQTSDYDIVVAHYDEDVEVMKRSLQEVTGRLRMGASHRITVYSKGGRDQAGLEELLQVADEVVALPNVGREGETYLSHILRHYTTSETNIAPHTIFMQPHIAWEWQFYPRLEKMTQDTGFLSFGPYINQTCGTDSHGQVHPRMADIYSMFRSDFCPPVSQLATWAGQFVVSRKRILDNQLRAYSNLWDKFHAPEEHWIWKEGWWNNEPSNPTLGHALERMWPIIFDCTDGSIAQTCGEGSGPTCTCLD